MFDSPVCQLHALRRQDLGRSGSGVSPDQLFSEQVGGSKLDITSWRYAKIHWPFLTWSNSCELE